MNPARSLAAPTARTSPALRTVRIALAALIVTASAQIVVPLPFTPVPFTLQPLAVLVVGGLLGAADGAASAGAPCSSKSTTAAAVVDRRIQVPRRRRWPGLVFIIAVQLLDSAGCVRRSRR